MSFGRYGDLVNEVIDVFRGVSKSETFPDADHPDFTSIELATQHAWETLHGEDELTWSDIRSRQMRAVWELAYASQEFTELEPALQKLTDELGVALVKHFRGSKMEPIGEDVIADMQNAVYARAVSGASNQFFEAIIKAYKDHAWPCGWKGDYSKGNLCTFARPRF